MKEMLLQQAGMTDGEVRVYLALLELGLTTTGDVIKSSNITSSKVYVILERLEKKGLVSHIIHNGVKRFRATNPERLNDFMNKRIESMKEDAKEIQKIIPELESLQQGKTEYETTMFTSTRGFLSARADFISDLQEGDEYVVFASEASLDGPFSTRIRQINEDNRERKIETRVLMSESLRRKSSVYDGFTGVKLRYTRQTLPAATAISRSRVLHMTYGDTPVQILIQNKELAASFKELFESVWKKAKK